MRAAGGARTSLVRRALLVGVVLAAIVPAAAGCSQSCCTVDSYPIPLGRAPLGAPPPDGGAEAGIAPGPDGGALLALAGLPVVPGVTFPMVVDTGSPFTLLAGAASATSRTSQESWNLYSWGVLPPGCTAPGQGCQPPLRASFRGLDTFELPLQPVGDPSSVPGAVLGADILRGYSVEFRFGQACAAGAPALCSSMTLWSHLAEDASLLEDAGYAVVNFTPFGGGEVTADGDPDFLGLRGPLTIPATRVVLRSCALADPFTPMAGSPKLTIAGCNTSQDANVKAKSGVDLSLMIDTGVGPLVLGASAWARLVTAGQQTSEPKITLPDAPTTPGAGPPLYVATWPDPIPVLLWTSIPRYALVNLEIGANDDPGPCVELARSRRTELVSYVNANDPTRDLCGAKCDLDPNNNGVARNSAAYLEVSGAIPVAVISDDEPFLQGLRFDILPEGPELDGLVGAAALGRARMELDYLSSTPRAVFSCETDAPPDACKAAARCPQLPDHSSVHYCFGLGPQTLPPSCAPPDAGSDAAAGASPSDGGADASDGGISIP
jgi:hypothetical protein